MDDIKWSDDAVIKFEEPKEERGEDTKMWYEKRKINFNRRPFKKSIYETEEQAIKRKRLVILKSFRQGDSDE